MYECYNIQIDYDYFIIIECLIKSSFNNARSYGRAEFTEIVYFYYRYNIVIYLGKTIVFLSILNITLLLAADINI